ncbi:MAG: DUF421 domain-containing protein [Clostridia bacterium]|nr:DUF421 domain-containing protein [Clostridia bacterium]
MLTVFIRTIIIFIIVSVLFRLMGKRQIGEMEPYELVITLLIADIVSVPLSDKFIPLSYGIVAALALFFMHQLTLLLSQSNKIQTAISGKPMLVIDKKGINYPCLRKMSMQTCDLMQTMRSLGYFSLEAVNYALMETNGQLSVIPNEEYKETEDASLLPIPVITDGQWAKDIANRIDKDAVAEELKKMHIKQKDIILLTLNENNHAVLQQRDKEFFTKDFQRKLVFEQQNEGS